MNRAPLPHPADVERMPWPAQDRLATRLGLRHRSQLRAHLTGIHKAAQGHNKAHLEPVLLYTCAGCGMTRHLGLECRTCRLFATRRTP